MQFVGKAFGAGLTLWIATLVGCSGPGGPSGPITATDAVGDGSCTPSCHFKQCGDDGCGGSCGGCSAGQMCKAWQCVAPEEDLQPTPDATTDSGTDEDTGTGPDTVEPDLPDPVGSDQDSDGVDDALDNCPAVYNPNQADLDGDFLGDVCDPDRDGDDVLNELDCAPNNPKINPYAKELCHNAIDDNCNGDTDEENSWDCTDYFVDADGDGAGDSAQKRCLCNPIAPHSATIAGDCDDTNPALSPLAPEICDGVDNNCNLLVDDGCDDDGDGYCDALMTVVGTPAICPLGGGDCYDYSASVHPGAVEIEADDVDNDCDGTKAGESTGGSIPQPTCTGTCTGTSNQALLCALELCYDTSIVQGINVSSPSGASIGGAYTAVNHFGSTSNDLAPFGGSSYVLLATGPATGTSHSGSLGGGSWSDPYSSDGFSTHDAVEIKVNLTAPAGATGFSIDYIFFSEEYEEFIGSSYNDKFYMILNAPQTTGGQNEVINFTNCSSPGSYWDFIDGNGNKQCYIAINTAFSEACPSAPTNISGTGFSCAASPLLDSSATGSSTGWLQTTWEIQGGESFTLTFHIHDASDHIYDSEVILDNFRWEGGTVNSGTSSHN